MPDRGGHVTFHICPAMPVRLVLFEVLIEETSDLVRNGVDTWLTAGP